MFSIKGELLNRIAIENQDRVAINHLLPSYHHSLRLLFCLFLRENKKINVRSVKSGQQWSLNEHSSDNISNSTTNNRTAAAADAIDTLVVKKDGKQTISLPITTRSLFSRYYPL